MKIIKNYFYNVSYQLIAIIVPLITTPYITRVLGGRGVGVYAYTNAIIQYFVLGAGIGINLYGNRLIAYSRGNRSKVSENFWSIVVLRSITVTLSFALFAIFELFFDKYSTGLWIQSIQIIAILFDISWFYMGLEEFKITVVRNTTVKLLSTLAIFVFVKDTHDTLIYIFILAFSVILGNLTMWPSLHDYVDLPNLSKINIMPHLKGSFMLFIPQVSIQIYLVLNKTMLGSMSEVQSAGFYENSDKIVKVALSVVTAITTVMMPRMAYFYSNKNFKQLHRYLDLTLEFVTFASMLLFAGLSALAPKFSIWFMGSSFSQTGQMISILALICPFVAWSTVLGGQYLVMTGKERYFTIAVSIGAAVNVLFNIILIPKYATIGAVWATVISEVAIFVVDLYFVSKQTGIIFLISDRWKFVIPTFLSYLLMSKMNQKLSGTFIHFVFEALFGSLVFVTLCFLLRTSFTVGVRNWVQNKIGHLIQKSE